jgi:hypothetical protein
MNTKVNELTLDLEGYIKFWELSGQKLSQIMIDMKRLKELQDKYKGKEKY